VCIVALTAGSIAANAQTASNDRSSNAEQNKGELAEIVITAERRSVNLQTAPLSATVISGAALENKGVVGVEQLQFIAPSVTVDNFGQGMDFDIRGIGKGEHNSQTMTGVITYRDGVATFPGYFTEEPYYDIANLEILRGPQGTFAGQNAIGGAVFTTTQNPVIGGGYNGYIQGQIGNYTDLGLQGAVNIPISDSLAARFAFYGDARDSFYSFSGPQGTKYSGNPGDQRWTAGRISLLWQPSSSLSVLFKTDIDRLDNGAYPADPYTDRFATLPGSSTPNPNHTDLFKLSANSQQQGLDEFIRSSAKIDYTFGDGTILRSITAYQYGYGAYKADLDGTSAAGSYFADAFNETLYSQEVNLISPDGGPITWIVGADAALDQYDFLPPYKFIIAAPPGGGLSTQYLLQGTNDVPSYAAFGQVTGNLTENIQIQLGARYSLSQTKNNTTVLQYGTLLQDLQSTEFNSLTYKAALDWKIDDRNFLYGFVTSGFKPGGLNVPVGLGVPAPFRKEKVTDYEMGWKASFFQGHLKTQLDAYYNDYSNFQVNIGYPQFPTFAFEVNDPNPTKIYGFEAETQATFGALSFDAGIGVMHSSLGTFFATDPRIAAVTPCSPSSGPSSASCIDLSGHQQTYAPNFTFNFGAQYNVTLNSDDTLTPRVNFGHVSNQSATLFANSALGDKLARIIHQGF
jgi:iron complex outermembrane receptor protein